MTTQFVALKLHDYYTITTSRFLHNGITPVIVEHVKPNRVQPEYAPGSDLTTPLSLRPPSSLQYHALRPTVLEAAEARDLATLLWAHAELGLSPPALFRGLGARLVLPAVLAVCNEQVHNSLSHICCIP